MKKLSIEEKAKAYDEVREKIAIRFGSNVADEIFSQFEMSEDEKIKKEIINYFQCQSEEEPTRKEIHNKWIAWLEKKSEEKTVSSDCDRAFKDFVKRWNEEESDPHIKDVESTFSEKIMALIKENKALKDRYAFKPSEEQLNGLKEAIEFLGCTKTRREQLQSLYEQLKKLREE